MPTIHKIVLSSEKFPQNYEFSELIGKLLVCTNQKGGFIYFLIEKKDKKALQEVIDISITKDRLFWALLDFDSEEK